MTSLAVAEFRPGERGGLPAALLSYEHLLRRLVSGPATGPGHSALVDAAARIWSRPGFDTLLAGPGLSFTAFDYQQQTVATVLRRMRGRAILADEVGLGKTIEAALILSELRIRGLARRTLIVTPAGLVGQWQEELERKFGLPTVVPVKGEWAAGETAPIVVVSMATARREPTRAALTAEPWDLVIVDEAHRLRNPRSVSGRFARELTSRYLLLLTATPVENRITDLYELVSLVSPGLLGSPAEFRRRHLAESPTEVARTGNVTELRRQLQEVMVRHRRSEVALRLPLRIADTRIISPGPGEGDLYVELADRIRVAARDASTSRRLALRSLIRLAGSSPMAAAAGLDNAGWDDLAEAARRITLPAKTSVLLGRVAELATAGEQVLVFTAFGQTLHSTVQALRTNGLDAVAYHGSLSRRHKEAAIAEFRAGAPVLVSTEAAGEGRNLQFCRHMINLDLPWNPMQIEQRIGRLHRVGQTREVFVTNLVGRDTIEEKILKVLETKINLFELVVGELDMILGRIDDDFDFESAVFEAFVAAQDADQFDRRLIDIGESLSTARQEYATNRAQLDALVGDGEES
jgi:SNF2 family DNA or RNA helicase